MRTPVLYTSSTTAYNPPSDPGGAEGRRWGDYSYTSLDPSDDMSIWTIQEFCNSVNSYGLRVAKMLAPPGEKIVEYRHRSEAAVQYGIDQIRA